MMTTPDDVAAVQRFLGMITYLSRYLPSLSTVAEPIRRLTWKDETWTWSRQQQDAFERLKKMISTAPVLRYFDATKNTVIQCDSSSVGLGAVLLQEGQPVVYASKTLSATERRYAQIEKETLAILFACRKFEMYILGRPVTIQTDHQPLVKIFHKPLSEAPLRIQRMILALQRYNITLQFTPGKEVIIADMLSRAAVESNDETSREIYDIYGIESSNAVDFGRQSRADPQSITGGSRDAGHHAVYHQRLAGEMRRDSSKSESFLEIQIGAQHPQWIGIAM